MSKFSSYTGCTDSLIFSRNNRLIINNIKKRYLITLRPYTYLFFWVRTFYQKKKNTKGLEYFHSTVFILYKNLVPLKSILVRSFYAEILI